MYTQILHLEGIVMDTDAFHEFTKAYAPKAVATSRDSIEKELVSEYSNQYIENGHPHKEGETLQWDLNCGCKSKTVQERRDEVIKDITADIAGEFLDWVKEELPHQLKVFTWPCCSDLNNKMFVVGIVAMKVKTNIDKIFNSVVTADKAVVHKKLAPGQEEFLKQHGDITTVLMLDDCTSCT
jgi:hypothetical protein